MEGKDIQHMPVEVGQMLNKNFSSGDTLEATLVSKVYNSFLLS
jgi:hypothetical protein